MPPRERGATGRRARPATRARRLAVALLAGAVLAGVALLGWLAHGSPPPERSGADAEEGGPDGAGTPLLAARASEARDGYRVEDGVAVPRGPVSDAPASGAVVVRVLDEAGHAVPGRILHGMVYGGLAPRPRGSATRAAGSTEPLLPRRTDAAGLVRWSRLPEGELAQIGLTESGWSPAWVMATVGGPLVTLRTSALVRVSVRVVGPEGGPVAGAFVCFGAPADSGGAAGVAAGPRRGGWRWPGMNTLACGDTDASGQATLDLPPGTARGLLWVAAPGCAPYLDAAWAPHDTEVRPDAAREIEGVVRDTKGGVVADGEIHWETAQGVRGAEPVAYDGTFSIEDLPATPVRLEWRLAEAPSLDGRNVQRAVAGRGRVTLVVDLGGDATIRLDGWPREPGGWAYLTPQEAPGPIGGALRAEIDLGGTARFQGLAPGRAYVLWVPPTWRSPWEAEAAGARRIAYRRDVLASPDVLVVPLAEGRTLRGVIDLAGTGAAGAPPSQAPRPFAQVRLVGDGVDLWAVVPPPADLRDAREIPFRVDGVPDGAFAFQALVDLVGPGESGSRWVGEAPAPATDEVARIRLRPAPEPR